MLRSQVIARFKPNPGALAVLGAVAAMGGTTLATAHEQVAQAQLAQLREVVVTGARGERERDAVPATIDVLRLEDFERNSVSDIRDLTRDLPNIDVRRAPYRSGLALGATGRDANSGFNIRGLEGNRILITVDGVRVPRGYNFGANAFGRDFLDMGNFSRVEFLRGSSSALYGSDGLGGQVAFFTKDPSDYLNRGADGRALRAGEQRNFAARVGAQFNGDDNSRIVGATLAGRATETFEWLLSVNTGRANELKTMGTNNGVGANRTTPNPQSDTTQSALLKLVFRPNSSWTSRLTLEQVKRTSEVDVLSARATGALAATSVLSLRDNNSLSRTRFTLDNQWQLNSWLADRVQFVLSSQRASQRQVSFEDRFTAADRLRDNLLNESSVSGFLQADKQVDFGSSLHRWTYGLDFVRTDTTNLVTGLVPPAGETFPLKRFPDTKDGSTAFFVQNEIVMDELSIIPGVRFDQFNVDARAGGGYPGTPASIRGSAVSPKLGVIYRFNPAWSGYANWASGFRAPSPYQLNEFFENLTAPAAQGGPYRTIANPNLRPEKSETVEVGTRWRTSENSFDAAIFSGRYRDFIEDRVRVGGAGTVASPTIFQSINRSSVTITGFELRGQTRVARDWLLSAAYGQTKGKDNTTGLPLDTINPARLVLGATYVQPHWRVGLRMTHVAAKKDINNATFTAPATQFAPPAYTTFDLTGQLTLNRSTRITGGIFNLTNQKFWQFGNVRGIAGNVAFLDAFTSPGRTLSMSVTTDF